MEKLLSGAAKLGLHLSHEQLGQFRVYYEELVEWNTRMNLTTITDYEEVQVKHFLDSLTVALVGMPQPGQGEPRIIDIGTGAGFPGLPLKIAFPDLTLVLLDSTTKKTAFLRHLIERLSLKSVEVVTGRAEELARRSEYRERFDLVLSRAVASLPVLVELALPFCVIGGRVVAHKKDDIILEVEQAKKAISILGGELREIKRVESEEFTDQRWLVVIDKVAPTPDKYPRRPGIPAKRPITQDRSRLDTGTQA